MWPWSQFRRDAARLQGYLLQLGDLTVRFRDEQAASGRWKKRYLATNDDLSLARAVGTELKDRFQQLEVRNARLDALLNRAEADLVQARADLQRLVERADARPVPSLHDYVFKDDPFAERGKQADEFLTPVAEPEDEPEPDKVEPVAEPN